jgi:hypothetical protein
VDVHAPASRSRDDRQTRHFDVIDEVRAIENQVVWVSTNQTGRWGRLRFLGGAKVVDPDGVVLARTGVRGGLAAAAIDAPAAVSASRAVIDHLGDRRPPAYTAAAVGSAEPACAASWPSTDAGIPPSSSACSTGSPTAVPTTPAAWRSTTAGSGTGA